MARGILVPEYVLDADHILSVKDGSGNAVEYAVGREAAPAVPATANVGSLNPVMAGNVSGAVDVDLRLRGPGTPDLARWGWSPQGASTWRGKHAAHVLQNAYMVARQTESADYLGRPKLCALRNGRLVLVYLKQDKGAFYVMTFDPDTGWSGELTITHSLPGTDIAVDVVQYPDTGEVVFFAATNSTNALKLARFVAPEDFTTQYEVARTLCEYVAQGAANQVPSSFAIERMQNGRLVMLCQFYGSSATTNGLRRCYSDTRGASWSGWTTAGDYGVYPSDTTCARQASTNQFGGVSITRLRNGSLLAIAPALTAAYSTSGTENIVLTTWTVAATAAPRMRLLVSDDGDSWHDMVRLYKTTTPIVTENGIADGLLPEGVNEGAICIGDDGLPRIWMGLHGDSGGTFISGATYFDDLAMLTLRKPDVTVADVAPSPPAGTAAVMICGDAFYVEDGTNPTTGLLQPDPADVYAWRSAGFNGKGTLDIDGGSATYAGVCQLDAVPYRGAIWMALALRNAKDADSSIVVVRCNDWSELNERSPGNVQADDVALALRGTGYLNGWLPLDEPDRWTAGESPEWTKTNTGAGGTVTWANGGMRVATAGQNTYWSWPSIGGTDGTYPFFARFILDPESGGSVSDSSIFAHIQLSNATNYSSVDIRFTATGFVVYDNIATANVAAAVSGQDFSKGIEIVIAFTDYDTILGVFYRALSESSSDATSWASAGVAANISTAVGTTEALEFGNAANGTATSTWRYVAWNRGTLDTYKTLQLNSGANAWDTANPTYDEFAQEAYSGGSFIVPYDDGLRHGTRGPRACALPEQYIKAGLVASWQGGAGEVGDAWDAENGNEFGVDRIVEAPVANFWRSNDDGVETNIVLDAGTDGLWMPTKLALFGVNVHTFDVELNATDSWATPSVEVTVSPLSSGDVQRAVWRTADSDSAGIVVEGAGNNVLRFTGTNPFTPHQFKSNSIVSWYVYSEQAAKSYKIVDNDRTRLFLAASAATALGNNKVLAIYPDKIGLDIDSGTGYRYMRISFPAQDLPEGFHQLGLFVSGRLFQFSEHPEYGFSLEASAPVSRRDVSSGQSYVAALGDMRHTWNLAWSALRDTAQRTALSDLPGSDFSWRALLDAWAGADYGEKVCALFPEYDDSTASATFGLRTFDVYPVRWNGPANLTHVAYDRCKGEDDLARSIFDVGGFAFEEVG